MYLSIIEANSRSCLDEAWELTTWSNRLYVPANELFNIHGGSLPDLTKKAIQIGIAFEIFTLY